MYFSEKKGEGLWVGHSQQSSFSCPFFFLNCNIKINEVDVVHRVNLISWNSLYKALADLSLTFWFAIIFWAHVSATHTPGMVREMTLEPRGEWLSIWPSNDTAPHDHKIVIILNVFLKGKLFHCWSLKEYNAANLSLVYLFSPQVCMYLLTRVAVNRY